LILRRESSDMPTSRREDAFPPQLRWGCGRVSNIRRFHRSRADRLCAIDPRTLPASCCRSSSERTRCFDGFPALHIAARRSCGSPERNPRTFSVLPCRQCGSHALRRRQGRHSLHKRAASTAMNCSETAYARTRAFHGALRLSSYSRNCDCPTSLFHRALFNMKGIVLGLRKAAVHAKNLYSLIYINRTNIADRSRHIKYKFAYAHRASQCLGRDKQLPSEQTMQDAVAVVRFIHLTDIVKQGFSFRAAWFHHDES